MNKPTIQKNRNDSRVSFRLPETQLAALKHHSKEMDMPLGEFIRQLADVGLEEHLLGMYELADDEVVYVDSYVAR